MKRLFNGLLCAVFVALIAACSGTAGGGDAGADNNSVNQTDDRWGETFTISYDLNGGNYYDSKKRKVIYGDAVDVFCTEKIRFLKTDTSHAAKVASSIDESQLTFAKKTFMGWATTPDATKVEYRKDDEIQLTSDVRLYAVWTDLQLVVSSSADDVYVGDTLNVSIEVKNLSEYNSYSLAMRILKNVNDLYTNNYEYIDARASDLYEFNVSQSEPNVEQQIKIPYSCPDGDYIIYAVLRRSNRALIISTQKKLTVRTKPTLRLSLEGNALFAYKNENNQSSIKYTVEKYGNSDDADELRNGGFFCAQKGDVVKKIEITRNSQTWGYYDKTSWSIGTYDPIKIDDTWEIGTWTGWVELTTKYGPLVYFRKSDALTFTVGCNVLIPEAGKEFYVVESKFKIPSAQSLGIDTSNRKFAHWNCYLYGGESFEANDGAEIPISRETTLKPYFKYPNPKIRKIEFLKDYVFDGGHCANKGKIYLDPNDISEANRIIFKLGLTSDVTQAFDSLPLTEIEKRSTMVGDNPYVALKFPCSKSPCKQTVYVFAKKVMLDGCSDFTCQSIECDVENLPIPKNIELFWRSTTDNKKKYYIKFRNDPISRCMVRFYYSESTNSEKKLFSNVDILSGYYDNDDGNCNYTIPLTKLLSDLKLVATYSSDVQFPNQFTYWMEAVDGDESSFKYYKEFFGTTSDFVEIPGLKGALTESE